MFTIRQLVEKEDFPKHIIEDAINHFLGLTRKGEERRESKVFLIRQLRGHKSGHKGRQEKSVYNIAIEGFLDDEQTLKQTLNETLKQTKSRHKADIPPSASIYVLRPEDELDLSTNVDSRLVSPGGNVDNSQASYQHSPQDHLSTFSQKKGSDKQGSATSSRSIPISEVDGDSFNPDYALKFHTIVDKFRYKTGHCKNQGISPKDLKVWINILLPEELLLALFCYQVEEKDLMIRKKSINDPPAYLNKLIHDGRWRTIKDKIRGKEMDQELAQRLKTQGY
jgi:hypothetical protein